MSDSRFFRKAGPFAFGELATLVGGALSDKSGADKLAGGIADLEEADTGDVSLFCSSRYAGAFAASHAGLIVTTPSLGQLPHNGGVLLLTENPRLAFARIGHLFHPRETPTGFIDPSASIAATAKIGPDTLVGPGAVIGENVTIGPRCRIGAHTVIEQGVVVGADVVVGPHCLISHALIGDKVRIASHTGIGGEGFGFVAGPEGPMRLSQVGRVIIGDGADIGSHCAIDRGCLGDTVIGPMCALDNLVQVGHNVKMGRGCVLAGQAGVAGSTTIGDFAMIGGAVSISDHLTIGKGAKIAGKSGVMRDVAPGEAVAGYPAVPVRQWHKQSAALARLIAKACGKD